MAKTHQWISELEAARKVEWHPRTLRRKVVAGSVPVSYRTIEGKNYQYSETDLEKYLNTQTIFRA